MPGKCYMPQFDEFRFQNTGTLCYGRHKDAFIYRFMEVYLRDEYICTEEGMLLERTNDIRLYLLQKSFDDPVQRAVFKVTLDRLKNNK